MQRLIFIFSFVLAFAFVAEAEAQSQEGSTMMLGGDRYVAGRVITADSAVENDIFMAGERIRMAADVGGNAHVAGRRVTISGPVEGSVYAVGQSVSVSADVGGGASVFGAEVSVSASVGEGLRAAGAEVSVRGAVEGGAVLTGSEVFLDAPMGSDVVISAATIDFGPAATVAGSLTIYAEDPDDVEVPASVAPAERVQVLAAEHYEGRDGPGHRGARGGGSRFVLAGFLITVITVAALAAVAITAAPDGVANVRRTALSSPVRCLGIGFVTLSAFVGSGIVLAFTLIGLLLTPAAFLASGLAVLGGYVIGSYILGVGVWMAFNNPEPDSLGQKVALAGLGAFLAALVAFVPLIGWLATFALTLIGLGAIAVRVLPWKADAV